MSDMAMIERVARVLIGNWPEGTVYRLVTEGGETKVFKPAWLAMEDQARKVIEAMREPTEAIVSAVYEEIMDGLAENSTMKSTAYAAWCKGIDTALTTPTSPHSSPPKDVETATPQQIR